VIYLRSLTKSAAPGLRIAAIGARGTAGARLRSARTLDDFFVASHTQQAAPPELLDEGVRRLARAVAAQRKAIVTSGSVAAWERP
jgi:DNA-binding transcriptional MocR family regulator